MLHLAQYPDPDHGDVLVDDDLEPYELEVDRLDPELQVWLAAGDPRLADGVEVLAARARRQRPDVPL